MTSKLSYPSDLLTLPFSAAQVQYSFKHFTTPKPLRRSQLNPSEREAKENVQDSKPAPGFSPLEMKPMFSCKTQWYQSHCWFFILCKIRDDNYLFCTEWCIHVPFVITVFYQGCLIISLSQNIRGGSTKGSSIIFIIITSIQNVPSGVEGRGSERKNT